MSKVLFFGQIEKCIFKIMVKNLDLQNELKGFFNSSLKL